MSDDGLLSRIAEILYWSGRYVERAEDTARLLDVYIHNLLEAPVLDEARKHGDMVPIVVWPDGRVEQGFEGALGCFI